MKEAFLLHKWPKTAEVEKCVQPQIDFCCAQYPATCTSGHLCLLRRIEATRALALALLILLQYSVRCGEAGRPGGVRLLTTPLIDEGLLKVGEGRVHHGFLERADNRIEMPIL